MNAHNFTFGDALGAVSVRLRHDTVLEFRHERHTSRSMLVRACERASGLMSEHPGITAVLFDLRDHTSHDSGNTALALRWFMDYRGRIARSCLVTRSQGLASLASLSRVMMPWIDTQVFSSFDEAVGWCTARPVSSRNPQQSGRHPRARRKSAA